MSSVQRVPVSTIDGRNASLADHAGKVLLVLNDSSTFTPQYDALELPSSSRPGPVWPMRSPSR